MPYSPLRERLATLISEGPEWIEEKDFSRLTGYSASYFHKILKQLKITNPKNLDVRENKDTGRKRIFVEKVTLLEYLESKNATLDASTGWHVDGGFHKLRGLLEGLNFSENLSLGEIQKALQAAADSFKMLSERESPERFFCSAPERIYETLKRSRHRAEKLEFVLKEIKPMFLKYWSSRSRDHIFTREEIWEAAIGMFIDFKVSCQSEQEKEFFREVVEPMLIEEVEKYTQLRNDLSNSVLKSIIKASDNREALVAIQKDRNKILSKILEEITQKQP